MGTNSGTRLTACSSKSANGSLVRCVELQSAWLALGASFRALLPLAARSAAVGWGSSLLEIAGIWAPPSVELISVSDAGVLGVLSRGSAADPGGVFAGRFARR